MKFYKIEEIADIIGVSTSTIYRRLEEVFKGEYNEKDISKDGKRILYSEQILKTLKYSWEMYDEEDETSEAGGYTKSVETPNEEDRDKLEAILNTVPNIREGIFTSLESIVDTRQDNPKLETTEVLTLLNLQSQAICNYCSLTNIKHRIIDILEE